MVARCLYSPSPGYHLAHIAPSAVLNAHTWNRLLKLLSEPSVPSLSVTHLSSLHAIFLPLAVSSKGYLTMLLQGMLQEQQQHGETKLRNLVSYHLVLYDVGTVLTRNQPQLPAARVPSCFSKAVYDHGERSCTRNDLDPKICAIWACQLSFLFQRLTKCMDI